MASDQPFTSADRTNSGTPTTDGGDSAKAWILRGLVVGVLLLGSANAISFFFRSSGWGSLLGNRDPSDEAIGFPLTIWEESAAYGSHTLQWLPFVVNIASAIVAGLAIGILLSWHRQALNPIMNRLRIEGEGRPLRMQFSLRGLMITTLLAALLAGAARSLTPRVEVLAAIYALGPIALVALAYAPRRLRWQQRVAIIAPATYILIAIAIGLGIRLGVEFDKVLMGIFICWTPQTALAAVAVSVWVFCRESRQLNS